MDIIRLMIGLFATMLQGAAGLFLFMMKVPTGIGFTPPSPGYINIHFLGQFMLVIAAVMFVLTFWVPIYTSTQKT